MRAASSRIRNHVERQRGLLGAGLALKRFVLELFLAGALLALTLLAAGSLDALGGGPGLAFTLLTGRRSPDPGLKRLIELVFEPVKRALGRSRGRFLTGNRALSLLLRPRSTLVPPEVRVAGGHGGRGVHARAGRWADRTRRSALDVGRARRGGHGHEGHRTHGQRGLELVHGGNDVGLRFRGLVYGRAGLGRGSFVLDGLLGVIGKLVGLRLGLRLKNIFGLPVLSRRLLRLGVPYGILHAFIWLGRRRLALLGAIFRDGLLGHTLAIDLGHRLLGLDLDRRGAHIAKTSAVGQLGSALPATHSFLPNTRRNTTVNLPDCASGPRKAQAA